MRILLIDVDSLRPDHLGCYGYHRATSPNVDRLAAESARFTNCHVSDAPCLPSRTAFTMGRPGIRTGVVNHGGTMSEPFREGPSRGFRSSKERWHFYECLANNGWHTASVSPFPARHSAWHYLAGIREYHDTGVNGNETADQINAAAIPWLQRNARNDKWCLHVNYWDPHRRYRIPASYGNPFANDPPPAWMTEEIRAKHWNGCGLQSAQDPNDGTAVSNMPRMPETISSMGEYRRWIDGYDVGIRYMDDHLGRLLDALRAEGVYDETAIVLTADHGENQGELNYYGAHRTGDSVTHRVPLLVKWPGAAKAGCVQEGLHYQYDVAATILDVLGIERPALWHAQSFAPELNGEGRCGRDYLVLGQLACMAQRSVRFEDWIWMRTWHDGFSRFPREMLYNLKDDPHELNDLAAVRPGIARRGAALYAQWHAEMMNAHPGPERIDPLDVVLREQPLHANNTVRERYCQRLRATGREHHAAYIEKTRGIVP